MRNLDTSEVIIRMYVVYICVQPVAKTSPDKIVPVSVIYIKLLSY